MSTLRQNERIRTTNPLYRRDNEFVGFFQLNDPFPSISGVQTGMAAKPRHIQFAKAVIEFWGFGCVRAQSNSVSTEFGLQFRHTAIQMPIESDYLAFLENHPFAPVFVLLLRGATIGSLFRNLSSIYASLNSPAFEPLRLMTAHGTYRMSQFSFGMSAVGRRAGVIFEAADIAVRPHAAIPAGRRPKHIRSPQPQ
jgi:hypothetical protein